MGGVCSPVFVPGGPQHFVGLGQENSFQKVLAEILLHLSQVYFVSRKSFLLFCSFSFATCCLYVKPFLKVLLIYFFERKRDPESGAKGERQAHTTLSAEPGARLDPMTLRS